MGVERGAGTGVEREVEESAEETAGEALEAPWEASREGTAGGEAPAEGMEGVATEVGKVEALVDWEGGVASVAMVEMEA